jgi:hypothetical protein
VGDWRNEPAAAGHACGKDFKAAQHLIAPPEYDCQKPLQTEKLLKIRVLGDLRSSLCCGEGTLRKFIFSSLTLNCTEFRQRETLLFPLPFKNRGIQS